MTGDQHHSVRHRAALTGVLATALALAGCTASTTASSDSASESSAAASSSSSSSAATNDGTLAAANVLAANANASVLSDSEWPSSTATEVASRVPPRAPTVMR